MFLYLLYFARVVQGVGIIYLSYNCYHHPGGVWDFIETHPHQVVGLTSSLIAMFNPVLVPFFLGLAFMSKDLNKPARLKFWMRIMVYGTALSNGMVPDSQSIDALIDDVNNLNNLNAPSIEKSLSKPIEDSTVENLPQKPEKSDYTTACLVGSVVVVVGFVVLIVVGSFPPSSS